MSSLADEILFEINVNRYKEFMRNQPMQLLHKLANESWMSKVMLIFLKATVIVTNTTT